MSELVKLAVDGESCIAGGQCEMLEPDTFLVDDDTAVASVIGTGMLTPEQAAVVIERCPASAISIVMPNSETEDA